MGDGCITIRIKNPQNFIFRNPSCHSNVMTETEVNRYNRVTLKRVSDSGNCSSDLAIYFSQA